MAKAIASTREMRPKRANKVNRRVNIIAQQLIDKIHTINEGGKALSYPSEERSKQAFPLWVASQIISSREIPSLKKRLRIAKQAIQRARKMKKNNGITLVSDGSGGFGVYSQAYLLRKQCKANHPSTNAVRVVKEEVAA